jgi:hypothetical protein
MDSRTTVRLDDAILEQAKAEAQRRGETLTSLIDQGLRLVLAQKLGPKKREYVRIPVSSATGGVYPGVNLDSMAAMEEFLSRDEQSKAAGR